MEESENTVSGQGLILSNLIYDSSVDKEYVSPNFGCIGAQDSDWAITLCQLHINLRSPAGIQFKCNHSSLAIEERLQMGV